MLRSKSTNIARCCAIGAVTAAILLGTNPASAEYVFVTATGTVTYDWDQTGIFGTVGGTNDLVGETYTSRFVFDTSNGTYVNYEGYAFPGGGYEHRQYIFGDTPSLAIRATVTIGNQTVSALGQDGEISYSYPSDISHSALSYDSETVGYSVGIPAPYTLLANAYVFGTSGNIPDTLTEPFTYDIVPGDYGAQHYENQIFDSKTDQYLLDTVITANLSNLTVTVSATDVPEVSTWAMMLLGFASLGYVGYRRATAGHPALAA
jgi:hypothetical protein